MATTAFIQKDYDEVKDFDDNSNDNQEFKSCSDTTQKIKEEESDATRMVIIGPGNCGKTCILHRQINSEFLDGFEPTIFDNLTVTCGKGEKLMNLTLSDTAGQEDFEMLIAHALQMSSVIIFCYSVTDADSFDILKPRFVDNHFSNLHESGQINKAKDKILVANKIDCVQERVITTEQGKKLAEEIGALAFFECSAKTGEGVEEIFDFCADLVWARRHKDNEPWYKKFLCCF